MSERAVATLFVLLVLTVLAAYAVEIALALGRLRGGPRPRPGPWRRRWRTAVLVLGTLGSACVAWGLWVEPGWLEVRRLELPLARLPPGASPVRLVQVSDLHVDRRPGLEQEVPALVRAERPDLIVFTGDALNAPEGRERLLDCLAALARIAPLYAVEGNWDVLELGAPNPLPASAARLLRGEAVEVEVRGTRLRLLGSAFGEEALLPALVAAQPRETPLIVLQHTPDPILELAALRVDAVLAGHTHGGQVRLPLYGALLTFARHGKRFDMGLYRVQDTWLYVNRGVGMEGGLAPRVRFLARPEITVLDLVPVR